MQQSRERHAEAAKRSFRHVERGCIRIRRIREVQRMGDVLRIPANAERLEAEAPGDHVQDRIRIELHVLDVAAPGARADDHARHTASEAPVITECALRVTHAREWRWYVIVETTP